MAVAVQNKKKVGWAVRLVETVIVAGVYFLLARLGQALAIGPDDKISLFWPAAGFALVVILLRGYDAWPGIWLGAMVANTIGLVDVPEVSLARGCLVGSAIAIGATVQAGAGAALFRSWSCDPSFQRVRDVVWLAVIAIVSCLISPTVGATAMSWGGFAQHPYSYTWMTWFLGDAVGVILAAPIILAWQTSVPAPGPERRSVEAALISACTVAAALVIFTRFSPLAASRLPVTFLMAPVFLWAAVRFGQVGAALSTGVVSAIAAWGVVDGYGPFFQAASPLASHVLLQAFMVNTMISVLILAAALSERRAATRGKRESQEQYRDLCENTRDLIQSVAPDGSFLYVNNAWKKTLGYDNQDVARLSVFDVIHPDDREHCQTMFQRVVAGELPENIETRFVTRHGETIHVEGGSSCRFENGKPAATRGIFHDITYRKEAEAALAQSEERLQSIVDNSTAVIYLKDLAGRYLLINRRYEELFGITNEQACGKTDYDLFPREMADAFRENDRRVADLGEVVECEEVAPHDDGPHTYISIKFPLRDAQSKVYAVAGISTDITDRKKAEEHLARNAAELARSNKDLQQFAYVASHDLQEPLRAVAGFAQLLQRRYRDHLQGEAVEFLDHIVDGARRMERLLADLLAYSRVNTEGRPFRPVDCNHALRVALANLQAPIAESGAIVKPARLPTISADETQLVQLFQNLISNAIKYCTAQRPEIQIAAEPQDGGWVFSVRDNGIGMDQHHRDRVFVIFQRLHTREQYPGTGVGLAICKRIVERHGGRIWVESTPGEGSVFSFMLPARHEAS